MKKILSIVLLLLVVSTTFLACSKKGITTTQNNEESSSTSIINTTETSTEKETKSEGECFACVLSEASAVATGKYDYEDFIDIAYDEGSREGKEYYCIAIGFQTSNIGVTSAAPELLYKDTNKAVESIDGNVELHTFHGTSTTSDENIGHIRSDAAENIHNMTVFLIYSDHKIEADNLYIKMHWYDREEETVPIQKENKIISNPVGIHGESLVTINGKMFVFCVGQDFGGGVNGKMHYDYQGVDVWNVSEPFSEDLDISEYTLNFYNPESKKEEMINNGLSPYLNYDKKLSTLEVGYCGKEELFDYTDDEFQEWTDNTVPVLTDKDGNKLYFCNLF